GNEIEHEPRFDGNEAIFAEQIEDEERVMFDLGLPFAVLFLVNEIPGAADDRDDEKRGEEDAEAEPLEPAEKRDRIFGGTTAFGHGGEGWGKRRAAARFFAKSRKGWRRVWPRLWGRAWKCIRVCVLFCLSFLLLARYQRARRMRFLNTML